MHHDGVHPVGHGEGLQVGLDGDGQRQFIDEVHRSTGHDGPTAQVLQTEDWDRQRTDHFNSFSEALHGKK